MPRGGLVWACEGHTRERCQADGSLSTKAKSREAVANEQPAFVFARGMPTITVYARLRPTKNVILGSWIVIFRGSLRIREWDMRRFDREKKKLARSGIV
jgi:hypothetical protein